MVWFGRLKLAQHHLNKLMSGPSNQPLNPNIPSGRPSLTLNLNRSIDSGWIRGAVWLKDIDRITTSCRRSSVSMTDSSGFGIGLLHLFSMIIPIAFNSIWAAWMSASIFTIFAKKISSISRQSGLARARVNWWQIMSPASLRSSTPAGNGMRSLMVPTNPATEDVALFLSDRFLIHNTSFGDLMKFSTILKLVLLTTS